MQSRMWALLGPRSFAGYEARTSHMKPRRTLARSLFNLSELVKRILRRSGQAVRLVHNFGSVEPRLPEGR